MTHRKGKRPRFKKVADVQNQWESIEKEQVGFRKGAKGQRINSIEKSRQRFENVNRKSEIFSGFPG